MKESDVGNSRHEADLTGRRIGAWRIVRLLSRGGMGEVYLAERADGGFQQQAALKLLRPGIDTREIVQRFEQERQILARLDHPNIARLLDGGATENGHPWLAMEYVDGELLDGWCDQQRQSVAQRIELMRQICEAVQFAHQQLVVHRDLKPSNIMVTREGVPKLLDFGIAKLLQSESETPELTATGLRMLTPDYASPEQVRGEAVTTATDVYALGVVLYQLIAGTKPYQVATTAPQEMLQVVCEQTPALPSAAFKRVLEQNPERARKIAYTRSTNPDRLIRRLRGDLDTITLTAMRKEPERRYGTPGLMAADVKRLQDGMPITARKDSLRYRSVKFLRRNTVPVAAAALVLLALISGLGTALWQADRATQAKQQAVLAQQRAVEEARQADLARQLAEARFEDVRELANALVFELHDAIADLPGSTPARRLLVEKGLIYLERLADGAVDEPKLMAELSMAYLKIGDAQGHPEKASLGDLDGALTSYRKALSIRRQLARDYPESAPVLMGLADALDRVGSALFWQGRAEQALQFHHEALAARLAAIRYGDGNSLYKRGVADTKEFLGRILTLDFKFDEAMTLYAQALAIRQAQHKADPGNPRRTRELVKTLLGRGHTLMLQNPLQALPDFRKAVELASRGLAANPKHRPLAGTLIAARLRLAEALLQLQLKDQSIAEHQRALKAAERLVVNNPYNANARARLAQAHDMLGVAYVKTGAYGSAEEHAREALTIYQDLAGANPQSSGMLESVALAHRGLAQALGPPQRFDEARKHFEKALKIRRQLVEQEPNLAAAHRAVAVLLQDLGTLSLRRANTASTPRAQVEALAAAISRYRESLTKLEHVGAMGSLTANDRNSIAGLENAIAALQTGLKQMRQKDE